MLKDQLNKCHVIWYCNVAKTLKKYGQWPEDDKKKALEAYKAKKYK